LQGGLADAEDALDIGGRQSLPGQVGDEGLKPRQSGCVGDRRFAEEIDPVRARFPDTDGAARLFAMPLIIVEQDIGERDRLAGSVLRPVLFEIAL
jgi:hypothetical protein